MLSYLYVVMLKNWIADTMGVIRLEPFLLGPEDADMACLLIHGFSGSPPEMREMGEVLAAHGIRVYGVLLTGHGGDPEELVRSGRKQWIASAEAGLRQLERYPSVFIAGLSMGGVLSLLLAEHHPERIKGVITLSTPTRFTGGWHVRALPVARHFIQWFYPLKMMNFNNPRVQEEVLRQAQLRNPDATIDFTDAQVVNAIKEMVRLPVPALDELVRMTNIERRGLSKVCSPLLIIQSKRDQTVNPACAEELYRLAVHASPKELHWLEQSDHVITTGPEREKVFALCLAFMQSVQTATE